MSLKILNKKEYSKLLKKMHSDEDIDVYFIKVFLKSGESIIIHDFLKKKDFEKYIQNIEIYYEEKIKLKGGISHYLLFETDACISLKIEFIPDREICKIQFYVDDFFEIEAQEEETIIKQIGFHINSEKK